MHHEWKFEEKRSTVRFLSCKTYFLYHCRIFLEKCSKNSCRDILLNKCGIVLFYEAGICHASPENMRQKLHFFESLMDCFMLSSSDWLFDWVVFYFYLIRQVAAQPWSIPGSSSPSTSRGFLNPTSPLTSPNPVNSFLDIQREEKEQTEALHKSRSRPLHLIELEERAMAELVEFYGARENPEERITVEPVLPKLAAASWYPRTHWVTTVKRSVVCSVLIMHTPFFVSVFVRDDFFQLCNEIMWLCSSDTVNYLFFMPFIMIFGFVFSMWATWIFLFSEGKNNFHQKKTNSTTVLYYPVVLSHKMRKWENWKRMVWFFTWIGSIDRINLKIFLENGKSNKPV